MNIYLKFDVLEERESYSGTAVKRKRAPTTLVSKVHKLQIDVLHLFF